VIIYGRNPVREAIRGPRTVYRIWASSNAAREPWLEQLQAITFRVSAEELERIGGSPAHQGVCAEVSDFHYADAAELLRRPEPLIVALDQVQDPRNLGAVCRSAEAAGAVGVVIPERRAAMVTPVACKTSAGAVEHLEVAHVRNLADWLAEAKEAGFWIWGADADGEQAPWQVDLTGPTVLVLGGEGKGLRPRVASSCDGLVALPRHGEIESLNVSAAATALLFESVRQRSQ
jgi:23S rRNA (guanosine2251-2'-O)-methyltransferase